MTMYDEDRVVTLLREVDLPQAPADRLGQVTRRARRSESRHATALVAVMAVVLGAGVLSAVSLRDRGNSEVLTVAGAANATSAAGSARMTMEFEFDAKTQQQAGFPTGAYRVSGPVDFVNKRAALKGTTLGQQVEIRIIGKDRWMKVPTPVGSGGIGGKPWLHSVESATDRGSALSDFPDPTEMLEQLKAEGTVLSTRQIDDGTRTVVRVPVENAPASFEGETHADLTVDTDGDGRIRVMKSVTTLQEVSVTMTLRFDDFGIDVDVQPPPADQVQESASSSSSGSQTFSGGVSSSASPEDRQRACETFKASRAQQPTPRTEQEKEQLKRFDEMVAQVCKD